MFQRLFGRRTDLTALSLRFDLHSHLLPGVDDGARNDRDALAGIAALSALGYQGAVVTPHINPDAFDNDEDDLRRAFAAFAPKARERFPDFGLQLGAEYYACPQLLERLDTQPDSLLRFGADGRFLLLEFPTITLPVYTNDVLTACRRLSITPIVAHPERYADIQADRGQAQVRVWRAGGVLIQVNLGSLIGQYDARCRATARSLGEMGLIDFLGSDLHRAEQAQHYVAPAWRWLARSHLQFDPRYHHSLFAADTHSIG